MQKKQSVQGGIWSYITEDGKQGAMVELFCETDFAARTEIFKQSAQLIAHGLIIGVPEENTQRILDNLKIMLKESVRLGRHEVFNMYD